MRLKPLGRGVHCLHAGLDWVAKASSLGLWWALKVAPILEPPDPLTFPKVVRIAWNLKSRPQMIFCLTKVEDFNCHFWNFWDHSGNVQTMFGAFERFRNTQGAETWVKPWSLEMHSLRPTCRASQELSIDTYLIPIKQRSPLKPRGLRFQAMAVGLHTHD